MGVSGVQTIFGWIDFNNLRDVREGSGLIYRQEYKPTISSLEEYEVDINQKTANFTKYNKERFINGKDESFIRNANWANGAVSLNISKEGEEQYNQQSDFLKQHIVISSHYYETKFNYNLNLAMDKNYIARGGTDNRLLFDDLNAEEWSNCLLKTYAEAYDEIVTGYTQGIRELYVPDENEECGFRKLNLQDELGMLRKEMNSQVDYLDRLNELHKERRKMYIEVERDLQMHKYGQIVEDPEKKFEDKYFKRLKEKINNALDTFHQMYQKESDLDKIMFNISI